MAHFSRNKLVRDSLEKISILFWQNKIAATKRPIKKLALRVQLENKETHFFCPNANHYQPFYSSGRCKYLNGHWTFYSSEIGHRSLSLFSNNHDFLDVLLVQFQKSKWGRFLCKQLIQLQNIFLDWDFKLCKRAKKQPFQMCKFDKRISSVVNGQLCAVWIVPAFVQIGHFYSSPCVCLSVELVCTSPLLQHWPRNVSPILHRYYACSEPSSSLDKFVGVSSFSQESVKNPPK